MNPKVTQVANNVKDLITSADPFANGDASGKSFINDIMWLVDNSRGLSAVDYRALADNIKATYGSN